MKSFKQYITESEEPSSYPWKRQEHGGWWHPTEKHITWRWDIDGGESHVTKVAQSPHLFGLNHDDIHNTIMSNDPRTIAWRKHYGWSDDQLKKKLVGGIIDNFPPVEELAFAKGFVGVRRSGNLSLRGMEPGLQKALGHASLHIPQSKLETETINLYDSGNNKHFDLTGYKQMDRYIKHGSRSP